MPATDLVDWIAHNLVAPRRWCAKRLSGNDTLANDAHQAGPYLPKPFLFQVLPGLHRPDKLNPDILFDCKIDSHDDRRTIRGVWYNSKKQVPPTGGRDEARLTRFGGRNSALLDPDNTGALAVFSFHAVPSEVECQVWVCRNESEEALLEGVIGEVEPGKFVRGPSGSEINEESHAGCVFSAAELPKEWLTNFPTPSELVSRAIELRPADGLDPDARLVARRDCEFELFRSVETAVEFPRIQSGFPTIDAFLSQAQSMLQRRKARAGRSLELHTREIFTEEGLTEGSHYSFQPESDPGKKPDFLFPSEAAYKDQAFPASKLRVLAVKTTCRDRWRQVLAEADRIPEKHLFTLQEGVSQSQFQEMRVSGVRLVVPKSNLGKFKSDLRPELISLDRFIQEIRHLPDG